MTTPAYLLVFSDPGDGVSEEEFTDWYDNEHVPLRLDIPAFLNWTRWKTADGKRPAWAASYDLTSYEETLQPPYSRLAETRSEREKRIFKDVGVLERRTYELLAGDLPPPSPLFNPKKPARFIRFWSMDVAPGGEELFSKWYDEEHIPMLSKLPGWVRSRRFVSKDWTRAGVEGQTNQEAPPKFLAVHEWQSMDALKNPDIPKSWETPLKMEVDKVITRRNLRVFEYYRHWEK
jgi:hypothetical protein